MQLTKENILQVNICEPELSNTKSTSQKGKKKKNSQNFLYFKGHKVQSTQKGKKYLQIIL